ncbi:FGGY-family carbohydrate kinase [Thermodesulfobacteriota bacterium]
MNQAILSIDVSSFRVKSALVSTQGEIIAHSSLPYHIFDENHDGFAKRLDLSEIWSKIISCMKEVLNNSTIRRHDIIAVSSCTQRIAIVFMDENFDPIYAGPNIDARGIDSVWEIDDAYEHESDLFKITAHSPHLLFGLARLLWLKQENPEKYKKINRILMLDDWIQYKLSGEIASDVAIASESHFLDISQRKWSGEILEKFNLNREWFPPLIESGSIIANVLPEIAEKLGVPPQIPVVKSGADTQTALIGMGCIEDGQIGISLGTSAPVMLVMKQPRIDANLNLWTCCHSIPDKWILEANTGFTGKLYDWYKKNFLANLANDDDELVESYISSTTPGANSTFAFLGPELMNFNKQMNIKPNFFVFPSQSSISDIISDRKTFARAVLENIGYGILENYTALREMHQGIKSVYCAGGMSHSKGFLQILSNILNCDLYVPKIKDSTHVGQLIHCLVGLNHYANHKDAVKKLVKYEKISSNTAVSKTYQNLFDQWKIHKEKIDQL